MNNISLQAYIRNLDSKTVLEQLLEGQSSGVLGESVYLKIEDKLTDIDEVNKFWNTLDSDSQEDFLRIYFESNKGLDSNSVEDRNLLLKSFYIYESIRNGDAVLFGLSDTYSYLKDCFTSLLTTSNEDVKTHRSEAVLQDSAIVLSMVRGGRLKRRIDGTIQKSALDEFARTSVVGLGIDKKDPQSIALFLELLLSTLKKLNIIHFTDSGFVISEQGEQVWRDSFKSITKNILEHAKRITPLGNVDFIVNLLDDNVVFTRDDAKKWDITESLSLLTWCGESIFDGIQWCRGVPAIEYSVPSGHIMPDFSVMVPREINAESLYNFLQIGEIDSVDVIYKAVISKEAVSDTLSRGETEENVINLFKQWNASEHLIHSVVEWISGFDRVFIDGDYLAVSSSIESQLLQQEDISKSVTSFSNYSFYRIHKGRSGELKNRLGSMGFDIRIPLRLNENNPVTDNPQLVVYTPITPNYSPNLKSSEPVQTNFGRYGGPLRKHSEGDLLKLVRFAILMEEKMAVLLTGETEPVAFTPLNVHSGDEGNITGKSNDGTAVEFPLKKIEKAGVVNDG